MSVDLNKQHKIDIFNVDYLKQPSQKIRFNFGVDRHKQPTLKMIFLYRLLKITDKKNENLYFIFYDD
jgi:hypothetical protein